MTHRESLSAERGSGTVLALGLIMVLLILLAAAQIVSLAAASAAQAARGADLAALAAADAARGLSLGSPCTVAQEVAARNAVELTSCAVTGDDGTEVLVRTAVPLLPERLLDASGVETSGLLTHGAARAGPPP